MNTWSMNHYSKIKSSRIKKFNLVTNQYVTINHKEKYFNIRSKSSIISFFISIWRKSMFGVNSWPDLVGKNAEEAKNAILQDDPSINVFIIPEGAPVTRDFRMDRVRLFVDPDTQSIVKSLPRRGWSHITHDPTSILILTLLIFTPFFHWR